MNYLVTLVKLKCMKIVCKVLLEFKSLINFRKDIIIKNKIKTNLHFGNTFTVKE